MSSISRSSGSWIAMRSRPFSMPSGRIRYLRIRSSGIRLTAFGGTESLSRSTYSMLCCGGQRLVDVASRCTASGRPAPRRCGGSWPWRGRGPCCTSWRLDRCPTRPGFRPASSVALAMVSVLVRVRVRVVRVGLDVLSHAAVADGQQPAGTDCIGLGAHSFRCGRPGTRFGTVDNAFNNMPLAA